MKYLLVVLVLIPLTSQAQSIVRKGLLNIPGFGITEFQVEVPQKISGSNLKRTTSIDESFNEFSPEPILSCTTTIESTSDQNVKVSLTNDLNKKRIKKIKTTISRSVQFPIQNKSECIDKVPLQTESNASLQNSVTTFEVTDLNGQKNEISISFYFAGNLLSQAKKYTFLASENSMNQMTVYVNNFTTYRVQLNDIHFQEDSVEAYCVAHPYDCPY